MGIGRVGRHSDVPDLSAQLDTPETRPVTSVTPASDLVMIARTGSGLQRLPEGPGGQSGPRRVAVADPQAAADTRNRRVARRAFRHSVGLRFPQYSLGECYELITEASRLVVIPNRMTINRRSDRRFFSVSNSRLWIKLWKLWINPRLLCVTGK